MVTLQAPPQTPIPIQTPQTPILQQPFQPNVLPELYTVTKPVNSVTSPLQTHQPAVRLTHRIALLPELLVTNQSSLVVMAINYRALLVFHLPVPVQPQHLAISQMVKGHNQKPVTMVLGLHPEVVS
jgi:hypothetical protein